MIGYEKHRISDSKLKELAKELECLFSAAKLKINWYSTAEKDVKASGKLYDKYNNLRLDV